MAKKGLQDEKIQTQGEAVGEGAAFRKVWVTTRLATSFAVPGGARDYLTWEVHLEDFIPADATPDDALAKIRELQGLADTHLVGEKEPTETGYADKLQAFNDSKGA